MKKGRGLTVKELSLSCMHKEKIVFYKRRSVIERGGARICRGVGLGWVIGRCMLKSEKGEGLGMQKKVGGARSLPSAVGVMVPVMIP